MNNFTTERKGTAYGFDGIQARDFTRDLQFSDF